MSGKPLKEKWEKPITKLYVRVERERVVLGFFTRNKAHIEFGF